MDFIFPTAIRALAVLTITLLAMASPPASGASVADCDSCPPTAASVCATKCVGGLPCLTAEAVPTPCQQCYTAECTEYRCPDPENPPDPGDPPEDNGWRVECVLNSPDGAPW